MSAAQAICFAVLFTCYSMLIAVVVVVVFMEAKLVSRKGVAAKKRLKVCVCLVWHPD